MISAGCDDQSRSGTDQPSMFECTLIHDEYRQNCDVLSLTPRSNPGNLESAILDYLPSHGACMANSSLRVLGMLRDDWSGWRVYGPIACLLRNPASHDLLARDQIVGWSSDEPLR